MPAKSQSWTNTQRARMESSQALPFVLAVVNGELQIQNKADKIRLDTCLAVLKKTVPDMKAIEHQVDGNVNINVSRYTDSE